MKNKSGIALIVVLSVLAVTSVIAITFLFTMRLEDKSASNFLNTAKAKYVAEMGIVHARRLLQEDKALDVSRWVAPEDVLGLGYDSYNENWHGLFSGNDVDVDGDGNADSRWINVNAGNVRARYAVLVKDEGGKLNLNYPNRNMVDTGVRDIFEKLGTAPSETNKVLNTIFNIKYGEDGRPGVGRRDDDFDNVLLENDGIDNDNDGKTDEPGEGIDEDDEFYPFYPLGDDAVLTTTEQVRGDTTFSDTLWIRAKDDLTVFSRSSNLDSWGMPKININVAGAEQICDIFKSTGMDQPWQIAANVADFVDADFARSSVVKATVAYSAAACYKVEKGSWEFKGGYYRCANHGGEKGTWYWKGLPEGKYYLKLNGLGKYSDVGDVVINGIEHPGMETGDIFGLFAKEKIQIAAEGVLTISIQNNMDSGSTYFSSIELIPVSGAKEITPKLVYGVEGVRINEIMVKPILSKTVTGQTPGGDWAESGGGFANSVAAGGAAGQGDWEWSGIPDGKYYLYVYAASDGQIVGDVKVNGVTQTHMMHGDKFTQKDTVSVYGGSLSVSVQNNEAEGTSCYFNSIILSQQPDGEYIELINLTNRDVDIGGWMVEGTGYGGWPAMVPLGTVIEPKGYVVLAADKDDRAAGLSGNNISFSDIWGIQDINVVGLDFTRVVDSSMDLLRDVPLSDYNKITLKDADENIVDVSEYFSGTADYVALEKGDPTYINDGDADGADEVWYSSLDLKKGTPGYENDNSGMKERVWQDDKWVMLDHSPEEITFSNAPLMNLGQLRDVRKSYEMWQEIELSEIVKGIDLFATDGIRLESEHSKPSDEEGRGSGWNVVDRPEPLTAWFESKSYESVGYWKWKKEHGLLNGTYALSLYGKQGESISISMRYADGSWSAWTPSLTFGAGNKVDFGKIEVGTGATRATADSVLEIRLKNTSSKGATHFDYLRLDPSSETIGKININTASETVLKVLPGVDSSYAQKIISNRPYGNNQNKRRGIGDILVSGVLSPDDFEDEQDKQAQELEFFGNIAEYITVSSDVFSISVVGQILKQDKVLAEKKIETVIER